MHVVSASPTLTLGFASLALLVTTTLFAWLWRLGLRRVAVLLIAWIALTGTLSALGLLRVFAPFPRVLPLFAVGFALTLAFALGRAGARVSAATPLWALLGVQGFRVAVELLLHLGATEGTLPWLMTWSGRNFDIVAGLLAPSLALLAYGDRLPRALAWFFAVGGLALLINVVAHAVAAMPTPFRLFDTSPPNVWLVEWPFIWLPMLLVPTGIAGQLLIMRRLLLDAQAPRA